MDINRNVLAKYQKMKKLNKSEEREREINFCQNLSGRSENLHQEMPREAKV